MSVRCRGTNVNQSATPSSNHESFHVSTIASSLFRIQVLRNQIGFEVEQQLRERAIERRRVQRYRAREHRRHAPSSGNLEAPDTTIEQEFLMLIADRKRRCVGLARRVVSAGSALLRKTLRSTAVGQ